MSKCGEKGLNQADRQNVRSASTAVNAILQLYRSVSWVEKLHRKILVFSVSHDDEWVKIYGHYALIEQDTATFHRHPIHRFSFAAYDGKDRWTAYSFIRKVYDYFAPIILKAIRDAVSQLPEFESSMSIDPGEAESELTDSRNTVSTPISQSNDGFVKPPLPPNKNRGKRTDWKAEQIYLLKQQFEDSKQELAESKQQLAESKQQHEENKQQFAELMEQNKKLMGLLSKN